jgi:hypothetical protein
MVKTRQFLATPFIALGIVLMWTGIRCSRLGKFIIRFGRTDG